MLLKDYLKFKNESLSKFGRRANLSRSSVSLIVKGDRFPSPYSMNLIELATEGQVRANDFMKQYQEKMRGEQSR
tara:strand:- start:9 stop:230 length:222 start_codon:yes stop_codon:yes gene_type:complete